MFRTVFPSIIGSPRLYIQRQVYDIQVLWLLASKQSTNLYVIYLTLYVQSRTPDDGRKDRPKHAEWYSINSKNCASSWFYCRNSFALLLLLQSILTAPHSEAPVSHSHVLVLSCTLVMRCEYIFLAILVRPYGCVNWVSVVLVLEFLFCPVH